MYRVTIHVPYSDNEGHSLRALAGEIREALAEIGGGYTEVTARGGWIDPRTGRDFAEDVRLISTNIEARVMAYRIGKELALRVKTEGRQEAGYYTISEILAEEV